MGLLEVKQASIIAYYADVPVLWEGPPGTGKTSFGYQMAETFEVPEEVIIGSLSDPTDVGGHPFIVESESGRYVSRIPDEQFHRLSQYEPPEDEPWRKAIAGLDEVNWSPPAVQATLLRFAHERRVGVLDMHGKVWPWSALNPGISGAFELLPSLANRFWHGPWAPTTEEWLDGMQSGWPFPDVPPPGPGAQASFNAKMVLLLGFLKAKPNLRQANLNDLDETAAAGAWYSGRTWEMAMRLLATADSCGVNGPIAHLLVGGCVGMAPADEFLEYVEKLDLVDPESVLADPDAAVLPTRGDKAYAVVQSVVAATLNRPEPFERQEACWSFLAKCAKNGRGSMAAAHARELAEVSLSPKYRDHLDDIEPYLVPFEPLLKVAGLLPEVEA